MGHHRRWHEGMIDEDPFQKLPVATGKGESFQNITGSTPLMADSILLYSFFKIDNSYLKYCGIEQVVAREPHKLKVGGSSPPPATKPNVAQLGRARFFNVS